MVMDSKSNVYLTDNFNNKLKVFNSSGSCIFETARISQVAEARRVKDDVEVENIRLRNPMGLALLHGQHGGLALIDGDLNDCFLLDGTDYSLKDRFQVLNCRGVAALPDSLVVTTTTGRIHILDLETGTALNMIERDANGKQILHSPYYVAASPNNNTVCITDSSHSVASIHLVDVRAAEVVSTYQGMKIKSPKGLCFDDEGQILVADDERSAISLFTKDCKFISDVVTADGGLCEPTAVAVSAKGQIVVSERKGKLKVFQNLQ